MIEVVMATLLVGVVLAAALDAVGGAVRTWTAATDHLDGETLAQQLLSDLVAEPYENLLSYDGQTQTPPRLRNGTSLTEFADWTRTVEVKKLSANDSSVELSSANADEGICRIAVTVTPPTGDPVTLSAIRSQDGAVEQPPGLDVTFITGVTIKLEAGENPANPWKLTESVNLLNHATEQ